jgi:spoIIIJ-associated protein
VAHAEASARSVDAAVTAAAAQLGLRSDQVDVEVIEEPVPSTFGYIGTPARVRVTPRTAEAGTGSGGGPERPGSGMVEAGSESAHAGNGPAVAGSEAVRTSTEPPDLNRPFEQGPSTQANVSNEAGTSGASGSASAASTAPAQRSPAAAETGNGQVTPDREPPAVDQAASEPAEQAAGEAADQAAGEPAKQVAGEAVDRSGQTQARPVAAPSPTEPAISAPGTPDSAPSAPTATAASDGVDATAAPDALGTPVGPASPRTLAAPDTSGASGAPGLPASLAGPAGSGAPSPSPSAASVPATDATSDAGSDSVPRATRPPRRTYKDEPIEPQMVEEDTERAGDFLEGLLDALDVDGDITTWVDEVGGHIDLEGADLDILVGSNGETLDALQELTRLAVLRQSKRRVRLRIDINGFRARQREQLTAMVQAKVEQVIRTREDHEFQPMTPAERKIVHDAVAAMEGVRTESLGEEPNRRVVIRPT